MDRRAEPELMNTKDQVDSYSEADFSKGEINFIISHEKFFVETFV